MKHVQRMLDDTGGDALRELVDTAMAGSTQVTAGSCVIDHPASLHPIEQHTTRVDKGRFVGLLLSLPPLP